MTVVSGEGGRWDERLLYHKPLRVGFDETARSLDGGRRFTRPAGWVMSGWSSVPQAPENGEPLSLMAIAEANPEVQATLPQHAAG